MGTILTDVSNRIVIDPIRIQSIFNHVCTKKSTGPDSISALLLKACAEELTPAWCPIFQRSVDSHTVPALWKKSTIVPVAKKPCPADNNDFRPVALTSIVMKSFEKYMLSVLKAEVNLALDPYQFAYRQGRGTDDAINSITHFTVKHLECPKAYARILFIDFSSAFNTLQPHLLISKLRQMSVNPFLIKWYFSFLTNRSQQVRVNNILSECKSISTGAPQGCVSSPVLFTLYTNDCTNSHPGNLVFKFSDDTAILSLLHKDSSTSVYFSEIENFVQWCDAHHLTLNVNKTKELVLDPRLEGDHSPVVIHDSPIEQVSSYKYLGVHLDDTFSWSVHVESLCSRLQQRLYFLRRLRVYGVDKSIMFLFYQAVLESLVRYGMSSWYGNLTAKLKTKLARLVHTAMKVIGKSDYQTLQSIYQQTVFRQAQRIDPFHILHSEYDRVPHCKLNRFKNSFVPTSITFLNNAA